MNIGTTSRGQGGAVTMVYIPYRVGPEVKAVLCWGHSKPPYPKGWQVSISWTQPFVTLGWGYDEQQPVRLWPSRIVRSSPLTARRYVSYAWCGFFATFEDRS